MFGINRIGVVGMAVVAAMLAGGAGLAQAQPASRFTAPPGGRTRELLPEDTGGVAGREGGIPRKALGEERTRGGQQEGLEEGLPGADAEPRIKDFAPRWAPPRGDWKLGVWGYNTESGVVVTRVARDSAAERRGIEIGDRIVGVDGYQVGYVGDMLYPLGYELQRQAGRRGDVLLLVQNVRGKELMNLPVQLDRGGPVRPLPRERE